ncbi:DNA starvation/stationary phase protection protein Dps [Geothrix sp. 21YS21S-4]|uniref:DNA starvation/stationary phase protection protein Dps n=1 Tax=Geothrix sp. 21YS21S-4 TaxID=3068889 RepID=UPI0027BA7ED4|nr:DNA starvation/stationary phase protection protein Dps [Geothrix sp. 21YS21S-4]
MNKHHELLDPPMVDGNHSEELVALLNQSLADTLDLAYQTKQAHWNVKGPNFYGLHLLFDQLYIQLATFVDDFAERAVTLGGQAFGTIRAAGAASRLDEYPLDARKGAVHVKALVDRYADYTTRVRAAIEKAEKLGDPDTADLYTAVSRAMDKALWMLTSHQEGD